MYSRPSYLVPIGDDPTARGYWGTFTYLYHTIPVLYRTVLYYTNIYLVAEPTNASTLTPWHFGGVLLSGLALT